MIGHIKGLLEHIEKTSVVVDVNNVGYLIHLSSSALSRLPRVGEKIIIYTHQIVREDDISLYGFLTREEKRLFVLLLSVSGIGPKASLSILAAFPLDRLVGAIAQANVELLSTVPGIGKKTAQKLVIELKDKIAKAYALQTRETNLTDNSEQPVVQDAIAALVALGYSPKEAREAVLKLKIDPAQNTEAVIKQALQNLV
ncbi:Holliday junction branch migration protein RuvA [Candidatus Saganbacteria bacterium]|nr:Holliday junction branch migration protein RuvA [Candidatus Saganbacteria bacterium]